MGSLMAGWDSPVSESDPTSVIRERNRSLTKEEIEAYWKSKKQTEEEHLKATFSPSYTCTHSYLETPLEEHGSKNLRSNSSQEDAETSLENIIKKNGWWTRSNWAFLNEPPVLDRPTNSYKPQFHVANLSASKLNPDSGISV
ncbi:hypothetical protein ES319_D05G271900v1 [Gossypium barbadense]|uniref:Uncharacterized protein n=2 Tax=Gossypium TaxID=3633 RepID=A0A5J5RQH8_GOSBA|nr:hypothetical protein ES319_D05G271900v1 [Gossypium barbadense]PPD88860.1 hypothetical protein GOBAR_DD14181 [Gossypium barbadense]TYH72856.1 hypothetical protein ES332_D05G285100v1 [Gossypium tomentosum]